MHNSHDTHISVYLESVYLHRYECLYMYAKMNPNEAPAPPTFRTSVKVWSQTWPMSSQFCTMPLLMG